MGRHLQRGPVGGMQVQLLRLVDDDQIGRPVRQVGGVALQRVGRQDAHAGRRRPLRLALVVAAVDHLGVCIRGAGDQGVAHRHAGKALPGALPGGPLGRRAQHQHALHAEVAAPQLGGGDRLHTLAQATLVGDQGAAGHHRKQRTLGLEQRQRCAQQLLQRRAGRAMGIGRFQR